MRQSGSPGLFNASQFFSFIRNTRCQLQDMDILTDN
jgi:hypothetical protein